MSDPSSKAHGSTIIPCLRYRDAPAAIEWLCRVFGFEKQAVYPNDDGSIAHAQLRSGNGMIMLGSVSVQEANNKAAKESEWSSFIRQPDELGGVETQSAYVVVPDADAVYARVQQAGVPIVQAIRDEDYGGRGFVCRDLEGRLWSFGSYDPWISN